MPLRSFWLNRNVHWIRTIRISRLLPARLLARGVTMTSFLSVGAWGQKAPTTPNVPWLPDHHTLERHATAVAPHEASIDGEHVYSLGELIDIAESNSPTTQAAWNRAKVTAASVGIAKSELYPTIIATVSGRTYLNALLLYQTSSCRTWASLIRMSIWLIRLWTSVRDARRLPLLKHDLLLQTYRSTMNI